MNVVSNTSVLIGLSTIGQLDILRARFPEGVLVPEAVWREVVHEVCADLILLDEREARRVAARLGLHVVGTVGLLLEAKRQGRLANLRQQLDALQTQGKFRLWTRSSKAPGRPTCLWSVRISFRSTSI